MFDNQALVAGISSAIVHFTSALFDILLPICHLLLGGERFYDNMASMIGFRINPWIRICWKYLTPLFCVVSSY